MFELNPNPTITTEPFEDTTIWYIDNFYQNPDEILDYFLANTPTYFKSNEAPGYNGEFFQDMRHLLYDDVRHAYEYLANICGDLAKNSEVLTNCFRFLDCEFNDYQNNYWWPHLDEGHTGIVFFNRDEDSGTNIYRCLEPSEDDMRYDTPEHVAPWRPKDKYELLKSMKPRYNRCILFNAKRYLHGQNIIDDRYTDQFRLNQVLFLDPNGP